MTVDGQKRIVTVESGHREATERWRELLRDLTRRGLRAPQCLVADGHLGIWGAVTAVWPSTAEQRCWVHESLSIYLIPVPYDKEGYGRGKARDYGLLKVVWGQTELTAEWKIKR